MQSKQMLTMIGFDVGTDRYVNWATTTAPLNVYGYFGNLVLINTQI